MSVPILQSHVLYGLKTDVTGNGQYITDSDILYPVGSALAIHNFSRRRQRLIRLPDKHGINIIAVTPNKKYVAVCDTGNNPTISIYDIQTLKRKKSLGIPYDAPGVAKFSCISFSFDSRCLAAVTGGPDQTMLFYTWENGKVESSLKVGNPHNKLSTVKYISCNPGDAGSIALGGPHVLKFLTASGTEWRTYGFEKTENILISSLAWLNSDCLLAGTRDGRILYLENGYLKNIYKMSETIHMNLKNHSQHGVQSRASQCSPLECNNDTIFEHDVRNLVGFPRGFAFSFGLGKFIVFERETKHQYIKKNVYIVPTQAFKNSSSDLYQINSISVNPSSDRLLVTTGWPQLFYAKLWTTDFLADNEPLLLNVMGPHLHFGSISGLSICAWKSLFMTCGEIDRSVRIWDYVTKNLIMIKQYDEDICSVALHPIGLFCLVGFSDKLRFMSILMDDLQTIREIPIRNCQIVAFSHGGHMFAAVNGNVIQVYVTIGFSNCYLLKGHTGRIKSVIWSQTDTKLVSIGSEGAFYEWDMSSGKRSGEVIVKGVHFNGVVLTADESTGYCIGDDRRIREIRDSIVVREYISPEIDMDILAMGKDDYAIFVTSPGGLIFSLKLPLQDSLNGTKYHLHYADVTKMCLSFDEKMLISTGADGSLCLWKVLRTEGAALARDIVLRYNDEVLIGKSEFEKKNQLIRDLTVKMRELTTEHTYKMRLTKAQHNEKIQELDEGHCEIIKELQDNIDKMQEDRTNELNNIDVEIAKVKTAHEETVEKMKMNYEAKLSAEYQRYEDFEKQNNEMRDGYERRLVELEKKSAVDLEAVTKRYKAQLDVKNSELEETREEMAHQMRVHEQIKVNIEKDADREIVDIRTSYETQIYEERQANIKLKGETGVLVNKYIANQTEIEHFERLVKNVRGEQMQLTKTILDLEKDISDLKKELTERDATIQDKEKHIYNLEQNNRELEKFNFVLDYKIRNLKSQIEPLDREIKALKERIMDMEAELITRHKSCVNLKSQSQELRDKLISTRRENELEIQRKRRTQTLLKEIIGDLSDVAALIQQPHALKVAVTKLHQRYSAIDKDSTGRNTNREAQCEFSKQRDYLERTTSSLRKQLIQNTSRNRREIEKTLNENLTMVVELNALKEELQKSTQLIGDIDSSLRLPEIKKRPAGGRNKLAESCRGKGHLHLPQLVPVV